MLLREGMPQTVRAAVGIPVELESHALERLLCGRERPVRALVRGELDDALETELALNLLDGLSGLVRDEPVEGRANQRQMPSDVRRLTSPGSAPGPP